MRIIVASSLNIDTSVRVDEFPNEGETLLVGDTTRSLGGKGANCAVAAARAGGKVFMAAAIGEDGDEYVDELSDHGVDTRFVKKVDGSSTGAAFIFVREETGDNRIVVARNANAKLTTELLSDNFVEYLNNALVVLQLEIPHETAQEIAVEASERNAIVLLNPSPVPKEGSCIYKEDALIWQNVDYVVVNTIEAKEISNEHSSVEKAARALAKRCREDAVVIVTQGNSGPVLLLSAGHIVPIPIVPAQKVVDTTGAGDTLTGYLAAKLAAEKPIHTAMTYAIMAASMCVEKIGAATSIPDLAAVRRRVDG